MLGLALHDQIRGAVVFSPRDEPAKVFTRDRNPAEFYDIMTYNWFRACLPGIGGIVLVLVIRKREQMGPLPEHPLRQDQIDEMERILDEEIRRRGEE